MTRRAWMVVSGLGLTSRVWAADPWKRKVEEWSDKDIRAMLTKSPWVKAATVDFAFDGGDGPPGGRPGGGGPPGGGFPGGGGPPGGPPGGGPPGGGPGGGGPPGEGGGPPTVRAVVRWESALPIRLARKVETPAKPHHYVVSVSGFPRDGRQRGAAGGFAGMQGGMKEATRIERKGKDPLNAIEFETRETDEGNEFVFTFDATAQPIEASDKEVTFVTALGPMKLRAKFTPKEMLYAGKLEV